jgi:hypothetical protein
MTEKYVEPSPADIIIRDAVDEYIDYAVNAGLLTKSDIHIDPKTLIVNGWTHLETESGVRISKNNLGYLELEAEFEDEVGVNSVDVIQTVRLFPGLNAEITEKIVGSNVKTVPKRDHERIATEMANLIKSIY